MTEVERAERVARGPRARFWQNVALVAALLIALGALLGQWYQLQQRADTAETSAVSLAQQVQDACESQGSLDLDGHDLCAQADDVVEGTPVAGPAGPQGPVGAQGERGFTGAQGPQGRTGPPGEVGPRGPLGPRGPAGEDGSDGTDGEPGTTGAAGPAGSDGATGEPGQPGPQGEQGLQGVHGEQGPIGPKGDAGPAGPACPEGYAPTTTYVQTRTDPMLPLTEAWVLATICTTEESP